MKSLITTQLVTTIQQPGLDITSPTFNYQRHQTTRTIPDKAHSTMLASVLTRPAAAGHGVNGLGWAIFAGLTGMLFRDSFLFIHI